MKKFAPLILAAAVAAPTLSASGATYTNGTATATMRVSLTLQANCAVSANPLNFGTAGVLNTAVNQTTSSDLHQYHAL